MESRDRRRSRHGNRAAVGLDGDVTGCCLISASSISVRFVPSSLEPWGARYRFPCRAKCAATVRTASTTASTAAMDAAASSSEAYAAALFTPA
ncbi:hypothetical protein MTO96_028349 [Rhipicephalus appendiculatus]